MVRSSRIDGSRSATIAWWSGSGNGRISTLQMTPRRRFVWGIFSSAALAALTARAQRSSAVRHIGVLSPGPAAGVEFQDILEFLHSLGWWEGKNVIVEPRSANANLALLKPLAVELATLGVDVIVTYGTDAAAAAKSATTKTPIVMASAADPVRAGLVASLAHPGGNITGYSVIYPDVAAKRAALLSELLPMVRRVAVMVNPTMSEWLRQAAENAYISLGLQPSLIEVGTEKRFLEGLREAFQERAEAVDVALALPLTNALLQTALRYRLPTMVASRELVEAGALSSLSPALQEGHRRVAAIIDKVLRGVPPAGLPIEQPTRFEFALNLNTASALGISIPRSLMLRADYVVR